MKYHLGFSADVATLTAETVHLSLAPNPSHLEIVNPVVEGRVRAKQRLHGDTERTTGVPLLIHGDAAFAGQGVVTETFNLMNLAGYKTGGTIHVVVNNQIGFTTNPRDARSTQYCTDIAKFVQAPIFHVNAEDPEACVAIAQLALEFRQQFKRDVVIDMVCYRKWGHNEGDDPAFTQPLAVEGDREEEAAVAGLRGPARRGGRDTASPRMSPRPSARRSRRSSPRPSASPTTPRPSTATARGGPRRRQGMVKKGEAPQARHAGLRRPVEGVHQSLRARPGRDRRPGSGARPHRRRARHLPRRLHRPPEPAQDPPGAPRQHPQPQGASTGAPARRSPSARWCSKGTPVRLSGQDSRRGTFTQRHAVVVDFNTGAEYFPLANLDPKQAPFEVHDSSLSEAAVLGFEYGYSLDDPGSLVMWEAQFGDFANGAQVIIDQFLTSGESKWNRSSGLVLLLPHAYEGQGPEHSSARLERFLQMCAEDNIQVAYPTTPAQYFHLLRRQVKRHLPQAARRDDAQEPAAAPGRDIAGRASSPPATSARCSTTPPPTPDVATRVMLCSGKVYYDLAQEARRTRRRRRWRWSASSSSTRGRRSSSRPCFGRYRRCREWVWVQEESQNMGGWSFAEPRLRAMGFPFEYVGRDASASPATGSHHVHEREQELIVAGAFATTPPGAIGPGFVGWIESNGAAKTETSKVKPGESSA